MYLKLKKDVSEEEQSRLEEFLNLHNYRFYKLKDREHLKYILIKKEIEDINDLLKFRFVEKVKKIVKPFKIVNREVKKESTIIEIKGRKIGGDNLVVMAGPCSIENKEMIFKIAKCVKEAGGEFLRGGAFKPRTSPYDFQGLGEEGLKYMREACDKYDLIMITEVMDTQEIELIDKYTDIFQIGTRNMQNFSLLKEIGKKTKKPILLKRGMSATIREFLMAAEYIAASGNDKIILCERGIRTFETATRNTVDINGIAILKEKTHLPIIIDASHGTGKRSLVEPVTLGCLMAGANGAMLEVHENPCCAISDADQTIDFDSFKTLMKKIEKVMELKRSLKCI